MPPELLDRIACYVAGEPVHPKEVSGGDLLINSLAVRNMALACRDFRQSAQEALFHYPTLWNSDETTEKWYLPKVLRLVRSLVERPDLAARAANVHIYFEHTCYLYHGTYTKKYRDACDKAINTVRKSCLGVDQKQRMVNEFNNCWGKTDALCGVALMLMPNLYRMSIRSVYSLEETFAKMYGNYAGLEYEESMARPGGFILHDTPCVSVLPPGLKVLIVIKAPSGDIFWLAHKPDTVRIELA